MSSYTIKRRFWAVWAAASAAVLVAAAPAPASTETPTKFVPIFRIGHEVNETTKGGICTDKEIEEAGVKCKRGVESAKPGGFSFPEAVAVASNGNVYVGDNADHRIQEFTANGEFVLMFGWNVNQTKLEEGKPQSERDLCTAAEVALGAVCGAGQEVKELEAGSSGEMFTSVNDVAVDRTSGNVYAYDQGYHRVNEFTATGKFVLMIGQDVNKTKVEASGTEAERNLCTAASGNVCQAGGLSSTGSTAPGAFKLEGLHGNLLAVGGPSDLLYVGDEGRVQRFEANGKSVGKDISLGALGSNVRTSSIAVDGEGNVFVAVPGVAGVHEYNDKAELQATVTDPTGNTEGTINAIALDAYGRLGVIEQGPPLVLLFETNGEAAPLFEFTPLPGTVVGGSPPGTVPGSPPKGLAFTGSKVPDLAYIAEPGYFAVEAYSLVQFPSVSTCPAQAVTATGATLCGEINPHGIPAKGIFEYGAPGEPPALTPLAFEGEGNAFVQYLSPVDQLVPNETYKFHAVVEAPAEGHEKQEPGNVLEFHTTTPAPELPGAPAAAFIKAHSVVLEAQLNPEHATTRYHFEYGPCPAVNNACTLAEVTSVKTTTIEEASEYGLIGATQEATDLAPQTTYRYRLVANNEHEEEVAGKDIIEGGVTDGGEATFETAPAPVVTATTGLPSAVTSTSAIVSGTVNPDGPSATYTFELGIFDGANTQFGTVFSGSTGESSAPVAEAVELTGLQTGTAYGYRVTIKSGYGTAIGATGVFTTLSLPAALSAPTPLAQLATPQIAFPVVSVPKTKPKPKQIKKTKKKAKKARRSKATRSRSRQRGKAALKR